jgi:hypothetical protein
VRGDDQVLEVALYALTDECGQPIVAVLGGHLPWPFRPARWATSRSEHFNRACALLDLIGSGDPDQPTKAQVDPREHRRALIEALDVVLLVGDAVEETDAVDAVDRPQPGVLSTQLGGQRAHVPDGQRSVGEHEHDFTRPLIRPELDREDPGRRHASPRSACEHQVRSQRSASAMTSSSIRPASVRL